MPGEFGFPRCHAAGPDSLRGKFADDGSCTVTIDDRYSPALGGSCRPVVVHMSTDLRRTQFFSRFLLVSLRKWQSFRAVFFKPLGDRQVCLAHTLQVAHLASIAILAAQLCVVLFFDGGSLRLLFLFLGSGLGYLSYILASLLSQSYGEYLF